MKAISTVDASQHLFYQNKFKESHGILEPRSKESVYHAHGLTAIATLEALMTFKPDDFKKALDCADRTLKLSDQLTKVKVVNFQCANSHYMSRLNWDTPLLDNCLNGLVS